MNGKTLIAKARISMDVKKEADLILEKHNTNMSTLIRSTLEHIIQTKDLPDFVRSSSVSEANKIEPKKESMTVLDQVQSFFYSTFNLEPLSAIQARTETLSQLAREYQDNAIPMVVCSEEIERLSVELHKWKEDHKKGDKNSIGETVKRKDKILPYIDRVIELSEQMDSYRDKVKDIQQKMDKASEKNKKY